MCQNGSLKKAQNRTDLEKLLIKTPSWSRPAKRLRLEGAKPLNLTMVTHFQLFFQRPRAPKKESKWSQNGASGHPKSQKIKKSGHSKKHWKTTLQKVGSWSILTSKRDWAFRAENVPKITKIRDVVKMGPQASKMSPWAPKMTQKSWIWPPKIKNILEKRKAEIKKKSCRLFWKSRKHYWRDGTVAGLRAAHCNIGNI